MNTPNPPAEYNERDQIELRKRIAAADSQNVKKGTDWYVGSARVILTAPDGGLWAITVDNAGTLGTSAL